MKLIKKIGWQRSKNRAFSFLVNQKIIHFVVIFLSILFVYSDIVDKTQVVSFEELIGKTFLSKIFSSEFNDNDQLIEERFDELKQITLERQSYFENLLILKNQPLAEMVSIDESEAIADKENLIQNSDIYSDVLVRPDLAITRKIKRLREEKIYYTVESGDTISTIAAKFNISVNTILWENNLNAYSLIRPGDKLAILQVSGVTYNVKSGDTVNGIAKNFNIEVSVILEINKLADNSQLKIGKQLIIPGGRKDNYTRQQSVRRSGLTVITDLLKPKAKKPLSGNKMSWPTVGYYISQYYSWRHSGLDIANKTGTSIYAADSGVIEIARFGRGYGNYIDVNHGGGKKTRYAHLSKFYVKKGQSVNKGEAIGAMGSTGRSTGPHLHFEIIINGIKYNPLNYIK